MEQPYGWKKKLGHVPSQSPLFCPTPLHLQPVLLMLLFLFFSHLHCVSTWFHWTAWVFGGLYRVCPYYSKLLCSWIIWGNCLVFLWGARLKTHRIVYICNILYYTYTQLWVQSKWKYFKWEGNETVWTWTDLWTWTSLNWKILFPLWCFSLIDPREKGGGEGDWYECCIPCVCISNESWQWVLFLKAILLLCQHRMNITWFWFFPKLLVLHCI